MSSWSFYKCVICVDLSTIALKAFSMELETPNRTKNYKLELVLFGFRTFRPEDLFLAFQPKVKPLEFLFAKWLSVASRNQETIWEAIQKALNITLMLELQNTIETNCAHLLAQPISPERFKSLTQGKLSIFRYIAFSRSGTDSKVPIAPERLKVILLK